MKFLHFRLDECSLFLPNINEIDLFRALDLVKSATMPIDGIFIKLIKILFHYLLPEDWKMARIERTTETKLFITLGQRN